MEIRTVPVGPLSTGCYVLLQPERDDCLIIDPGAEPEKILAHTDGRQVTGILLTHGHFDHIGAVAGLMDPDTRLYIHALDAPMLSDTQLNACWLMGETVTAPQATDLLTDGDTVDLAGIHLTVLHTPGHTPGSVCYLCGEDLFTGDTILGGGWGRTDLPGGSDADMMKSLRRVIPYTRTHSIHGGHI